MIADIFEILQYDFMVRAFLAGIIVSLIAPLMGFFLVIRKFSLMVDTLAHISLVGVAGSLLFQFNPLFGAMLVSVGAGIAMDRLRSLKNIFSDTVMAIFMSGGLALTLILFSLGNGIGVNMLNYLFGSITTITQSEILLFVILGIIVLITVFLLRKKLFLISYDEDLAVINGMNTKLYNALFMLLVGVTISLAIKAIGALLMGALMIIPVASAMQLGYGMNKTLLYSIIFSLTSVIAGITFSFYLDLPSSAVIVLMLLLFFVSSVLFKRSYA
ncbi:MAG TPA: metal ABC transporter permease [Candidatus Dojkabacteria bacterium]|nr:metal ABC transporter permease [Candidatus Dojkabacteria bacterium]HRO64944.1 metal ABC transporter permease [Candidatus Dojkabacteria bacterium]HRP50729.1 metal ABC transporter permease [Candidatus Dojkabacteria bacterium]